jgi:hypothetical protein
MSQRKTKNEALAKLTKKEIRNSPIPEKDYSLGCGKMYCPFLNDVDNAYALGLVEDLSLETAKLIELFPGAKEYYENIEPTDHQIARTGLERIGFSFDSSQQTETDTKRARPQRTRNGIEFKESLYSLALQKRTPLSDSGIQIVTDPGFGYDDEPLIL